MTVPILILLLKLILLKKVFKNFIIKLFGWLIFLSQSEFRKLFLCAGLPFDSTMPIDPHRQ